MAYLIVKTHTRKRESADANANPLFERHFFGEIRPPEGAQASEQCLASANRREGIPNHVTRQRAPLIWAAIKIFADTDGINNAVFCDFQGEYG
jgi:hypothetical protein